MDTTREYSLTLTSSWLNNLNANFDIVELEFRTSISESEFSSIINKARTFGKRILDYTGIASSKKVFAIQWTSRKVLIVSMYEVNLPINSSSLFKRLNAEVINLSSVNMSRVKSMEYAFASSPLQSITLSKTLGKAADVDMANAFDKCRKLTDINFEAFDGMGITDISGMFNECNSIKEVDFSKTKMSGLLKMSSAFYNCVNLEQVKFPEDIKNAQITSMTSVFFNCQKLKTITNFEKLHAKQPASLAGLFFGCSSLKDLDISKWRLNEILNVDDIVSADAFLNKSIKLPVGIMAYIDRHRHVITGLAVEEKPIKKSLERFI